MSGTKEFHATRVTSRHFVLMDEDSLRAHAAKHLGDDDERAAWAALLALPPGFTIPSRLCRDARVLTVSSQLEWALGRVLEARREGRIEGACEEGVQLLLLVFLPWLEAVAKAAHGSRGGAIPARLSELLKEEFVTGGDLKVALGVGKMPAAKIPTFILEAAIQQADSVMNWAAREDLRTLHAEVTTLRTVVPLGAWKLVENWHCAAHDVRERLRAFWDQHPEVLQAYADRAARAVQSAASIPRHVEYVEAKRFANEAYLDDAGVFCVLHGGAERRTHRLATAHIPFPAATTQAIRAEAARVQVVIGQCSGLMDDGTTGSYRKKALKIRAHAAETAGFHSPRSWGL